MIEPTNEILERLCEAFYDHHQGRKTDGIRISDAHRHNACNWTYSGSIDLDGVGYGFVIHNGDWNGTDVAEWGLEDDVAGYEPPPPPEPRTFIPNDDSIAWVRPGLFGAYLAWREESWFKDMERSYNYDRHFQPGSKIENHYSAKAAQRGMRIGYLSSLKRAIEQYESVCKPGWAKAPKCNWNEAEARFE